jgi:phosphoribosyl-ATP pyrophosphohydrolase/phosphoribosyl-AMP cyclohydrolase/histidinol dehydrogenase
LLRTVTPEDVILKTTTVVDEETEKIARGIIKDVKTRKNDALYEYAVKFGDIEKGAPLIVEKSKLKEAFDTLTTEDQALLKRTANRIERFARVQLSAVSNIKTEIPGGQAGHEIAPVKTAGCYAPGGRFPLPSSILMTAVTARTAKVEQVWVASPKPMSITLAAAHVAEVDGFLCAGGAQAIAAFAYGTEQIPQCDVIAGPGNKFVTAAKKIVSGQVSIDMLAGPSELTVLADGFASPSVIAADLLAQAEHDVDATPILITDSVELIKSVNISLKEQLELLETAPIAAESLKNGFAVLVNNLEEGAGIANHIAPEHLEIMTKNSDRVASLCNNYGGLFIGEGSAEVLGDYGAGPNHTLPTGGTARYTGGLSVFNFIRIRTWIKITDQTAAAQLVSDAYNLAKLEGLTGHAAAALLRKSDK